MARCDDLPGRVPSGAGRRAGARRAVRGAARALATAGVVVLGAACGGSGTTVDTMAPTPTAPGVGSLPAGVATTRPGPLGTEEPPPTAAPATGSGEVQSGPVQLDVTVGVNSGPGRVEIVTVGSDVTLNITNPDAADEFHVHVVDLDRTVDAGVMATFNFTVTAAGSYEVESHVTGEVLLVIEAVAG